MKTTLGKLNIQINDQKMNLCMKSAFQIKVKHGNPNAKFIALCANNNSGQQGLQPSVSVDPSQGPIICGETTVWFLVFITENVENLSYQKRSKSKFSW